MEFGGLSPSSLRSPTASTSSTHASHRVLPEPRRSILAPGSSKETSFIQYVDRNIAYIQRRFATPSSASINQGSSAAVETSDVSAYSSFDEVADDMSHLIDIVWTCSTPSLQTPYLLHLALLVSTYIQAMPGSKKAMFMLLDKLDISFASLLTGHDKETGIMLPGFLHAVKGLSETERVRVASLVEKTRVIIVNVVSDTEVDSDEDDDIFKATSSQDSGFVEDNEQMEIARVYERTMQELGDTLTKEVPT